MSARRSPFAGPVAYYCDTCGAFLGREAILWPHDGPDTCRECLAKPPEKGKDEQLPPCFPVGLEDLPGFPYNDESRDWKEATFI